MGEAIPKEVKDLWDKWNIRGLVILSLALQTILVLLSPNRKRTHRFLFRFLIWSAYLLANWAAEYAVGQISESQGDEPQPKNNDLLAFWSTFLLLHLGGPDTITALSLEDNDLWLRSLFGLVCQAMVTLYVFFLSIPNNLLVPTTLMLVAGIIKYVERIKALHRANLETFKDSMLWDPDPGPDYVRFVEEYSTRKFLREPTRIIRIEEEEKGKKPEASVRPTNRDLTHLEVVQYAYKYFNIFKGLVVDLILSSQSEQWNNSKKFFGSLEPEAALRVLEVELSFIYGTFYTKVDILHTRIGFAFRFIALASLVSSLCIFATAKKHDYNSFDVGLTYALLIGGISLDFVAIFIFFVSDWTFARWRKLKEDVEDKDTWVDAFLNWLLDFRKLNWKRPKNCFHKKGICQEYPRRYIEFVGSTPRICREHSVLDRTFIFRRWSEYIYGYNLIGYSLGIKPDQFLYLNPTIQIIKSCLRTMRHAAHLARRKLSRLTMSLSRNYRIARAVLYPIHMLLRSWLRIRMINYVMDFFGISDQLNGVIYTSRNRITEEMWELVFGEVKLRSQISDGAESANSIYSARGEWVLPKILMEKATNWADNMSLLLSMTQVDYDQSILIWHIATELLYQTQEGTKENHHSNRELSKILSDYMMYLLIVQPALMSTVAVIDKIRFMEAVAEAKNFLQNRHINDSGDAKRACEMILSSFGDYKERKGERDEHSNVLTDASILAKALNQLNGKGGKDVTWEVVSKVWVEMLCYAATHCDPRQHVAQLSRGGKFLSFVWLLMAHFGLGEQFQTTEGNGRARLNVAK